jgi:hypothetical protein
LEGQAGSGQAGSCTAWTGQTGRGQEKAAQAILGVRILGKYATVLKAPVFFCVKRNRKEETSQNNIPLVRIYFYEQKNCAAKSHDSVPLP